MVTTQTYAEEHQEFLRLHARTNTQWVRIFIKHLRRAVSPELREDLKVVLRYRLQERRWARSGLLGRMSSQH